jgi:hypothetical protein
VSEKLDCPSTGLACEYEAYCSRAKELLDAGVNPQRFVGDGYIELPLSLVKANQEYCSERKLEILQVARGSKVLAEVVYAGLMIDKITESRERYRK